MIFTVEAIKDQKWIFLDCQELLKELSKENESGLEIWPN